PALTPQRGLHRPALEALAPTSGRRLPGEPVPLPDGLLDSLFWPVRGVRSTARQRRTARQGETAPVDPAPVGRTGHRRGTGSSGADSPADSRAAGDCPETSGMRSGPSASTTVRPAAVGRTGHRVR